MSCGTIEYQFTECLFITPTHEAGELSGTATIDYSRDGAWTVDAISLDSWNKTTRKFDAQMPLAKESEVYRILEERLMSGQTARFIQSEVDEARDDDRASFAANKADHDYKLRRELV